ncbi:MAG: STAS domain-containing protein [Methylovulum sp.]|nr:STAS domain-containing protein [Methylovulum sp.]
MEIITQLDGDEMHIALRGRLDAAWSNSVNKSLQDTVHSGCHRIALDLSQVHYLSSAGIRVLVILAKNLNNIGGTLRLIDPSASVSEVLKLVGFQQLLDSFTTAVPVPQAAVAVSGAPVCNTVRLAGNDFEVYTLNATAQQQGSIIGKNSGRPVSLAVPEQAWVIGYGMLGDSSNTERAGELLAVDGLAVSLPGDDPAHPDWLQREGGLVPEVSLLHGLSVTGPFRYLLRFGAVPETPPLRLSELAQAALEVCASDAVSWAIVAETAHLIGAARQVPPISADDDLFAFPAVRDRLLFTAEPAYTDETCLIVGMVARNPSLLLAEQLRPMAADGALHIHVHACIVPFSPVRKGFIDLSESLERLMDNQFVRGVLHLLNDDREGVGAGESYLRRGALWCAPVTTTARLS